ncbi:MAG: 23S rRNA (uracil(1939)-C(5))-methyltransferase RlmD [Betaproteobacteria bacterium]|nr:23S rRNA (uracil(1939)-C(5))-methyltransferase RlmD [Betaproteobacteria bacterium]
MPIAVIESFDHEGRGVARVGGKTVFIEGALPGETVEYEILRVGPAYEQARAVRILRESGLRVVPRCPHFGVCGGCSVMHLDPAAQAAMKQRVIEDAFWSIAKIRPETIYPAMLGQAWGYRQRARLSVREVPTKGGVLIGFHEKRSSFITDLSVCHVMHPHVSAMLPRLHALVEGLSIADRVPQIEMLMGRRGGEPGEFVTVLVFRHLLPFSEADVALLQAFGETEGVDVWQQPGQPDTARPLVGEERELFYSLPEFDVRLAFRSGDFMQVNVHTNRLLVRRAVQLLDPRAGERIGDLFCGLGNFTLPIARRGATVLGVEGSAATVARATKNARANGLDALAVFQVADLFKTTGENLAALGTFDKLLLDPPREGAIAVAKAIEPRNGPRRIVYVSCNPATLARDAAVLVREKGYVLRGAGIANMFPHTLHVESVALFELP